MKNLLIRTHLFACACFGVVVLAAPAQANELKGFSVGAAGGLAGAHAVDGSSYAKALGSNNAYSTTFLDANNGNTTAGSTGSASGDARGQRALANGMHMGMGMGAIQDQPFQARDVMANSLFVLPPVNFTIPGF